MTCAFKLTPDCLFCRSRESNLFASSIDGFGLSQLLPEHSTPSSSEVPTSEPTLKRKYFFLTYLLIIIINNLIIICIIIYTY